MELISIKDAPIDVKEALLHELGFRTDGVHVLDSTGSPVLDRYTEEPVRLDTMVILPGSTVILDDNVLSITAYLEDARADR